MATGLYWNTTQVRRGAAQVRGRWVNALDSSGRWQSFSPSFVETPHGFSWAGGPAEYHIGRNLSDGATLIADNRYDIFDRVPITLPAAEFELQPIGGFNVSGQFEPPAALVSNYPHVSFATDQSQVWHPEAGGPGLHVRWTIHSGRAPRMTRELVVDPKACPQRDLSLSWDVRSPRVLALVRDDQGRLTRPWAGSPGDAADVPAGGVSIVSVPDQSVADQLSAELASGATETRVRRGSGIRPPLVWYWRADGTLVTAPATVRAVIQSDGETVRFTKTIPLSVIQAAVAENSYVVSDDSQTIYPDPQPEVTSCDGWTERNISRVTYDYYGGAETYADLIANPATRSVDRYTGSRTYHSDVGATSFVFGRTFCGFDLAAIEGEVTGATLSFAHTGSGTVRITGATTVSATSISVADHQNTYNDHDTSLTADTAITGSRTDCEFNTAGLAYWTAALGSVASCAVRLSEDKVGGTRPGIDTRVSLKMAEETGTSSDPYLEVTYSAGSGSALPILNHYMLS